jgi:uroporphyrinogen-III synthase
VSTSRHNGLDGVRVALLESRMSSELAELVRRHGGVVRAAPAVREAPLDCSGIVAGFVAQLRSPASRVFVFLTGAEATALLQEAERQRELPFVIDSLNRGIVVCRGPKPAAALKRYGVSARVSSASPYTSRELIESMSGLDLTQSEVTLVHYGERNEALASALQGRAAAVSEMCLYEWRMPDDIEPLRGLARAIAGREIDAVVFTSQVQWKHLARVACELGIAEAVEAALAGGIVVAAIGPICSAALNQAGVRPHVVPENPKMAPLVVALAQYFSTGRAYSQTGGG